MYILICPCKGKYAMKCNFIIDQHSFPFSNISKTPTGFIYHEEGVCINRVICLSIHNQYYQMKVDTKITNDGGKYYLENKNNKNRPS